MPAKKVDFLPFSAAQTNSVTAKRQKKTLLILRSAAFEKIEG